MKGKVYFPAVAGSSAGAPGAFPGQHGPSIALPCRRGPDLPHLPGTGGGFFEDKDLFCHHLTSLISHVQEWWPAAGHRWGLTHPRGQRDAMPCNQNRRKFPVRQWGWGRLARQQLMAWSLGGLGDCKWPKCRQHVLSAVPRHRPFLGTSCISYQSCSTAVVSTSLNVPLRYFPGAPPASPAVQHTAQAKSR